MTAQKQKDHFNREIGIVLAEIKDRRQKTGVLGFKLWAWHLTVRVSYFLKRMFDIVFSLLALIVLLPLFVLVAILIKLTSKGPVFFVQARVGRYGKTFTFYKFRSMYQDAEARKAALLAQNESADGVIFKMADDPRITPVGKILRKTSMDELPQFLNVLFGDMSLVGPRPPVPSEVRQYSLEALKRLNVRPGLTCLWQVSGRSDIPFKEQVRLDKEYISSRSFMRDLVILFRTVPAILSGKGAY